jgi:hypothetical protein
MAVDSLRLDQILRREITITCFEGIAVIQAICRELPDSASAAARFPLAMEVALTADGRITLVRPPSGAPGVVAAGHLLGDLLQADVPVRLRLIQSEAVASTPAFQNIQELSAQLAYFERPDTPQLLQKLFARAAGLPDSLNPSVDLVDMDDFLPEMSAPSAPTPVLSVEEPRDAEPPRVVQVAAAPRPQQDNMALAREPVQRRRASLTIVAGFVGLVVVASGAFLTYGWEPTADSGLVETATASSGGSAAAATTGAAAPVGKSASNSKPTVDTKPVAKARAESNGDRGHAAPDRPRSEALSPGAAPVVPTPMPPAAQPISPTVAAVDPNLSPILPFIVPEVVNDRGLRIPPVIDASGELLYSRVNADVRPPTAIRPHLPSEPPPNYPLDHLMVLELVITGKGDVESVRLLTAPKTVNDFMIVSAAKAWLFSPARLNGRPVKYRHRIRFVVP